MLPSSSVSRFQPCGSCRLSLLAAGLFFAVAGLAFAQQSPPNQANTAPSATAPSPQTDAKKVPEAATPPAAPAAADPRQAQIIADTQKLLKLSQELKAEVAKSSKDTLSLTVIKKADEVEKLAKTLKEELNKTH